MRLFVYSFSLFVAAAPVSARQAGTDSAVTVRRVAALSELAAGEYRLGVSAGRVIAPAEVEEARLFLKEAQRAALALPPAVRDRVNGDFDALLGLLSRAAPAESVSVRIRAITNQLSTALGVSLEEIPAETPSLARGAEVYQRECSTCHGVFGKGDGAAGLYLTPKPANLADAQARRGSSPLDYYRRVTVGSAGTAMPAFETRLSADDRWAAVLYATLLRLPAKSSIGVPAALQAFPTTARMSDVQLAVAIGAGSTDADVAVVRGLQAVRVAGGQDRTTTIFAAVRTQLDSAYGLARQGKVEQARQTAFDAYTVFEQVERDVQVKNPGLVTRIESIFSDLRNSTTAGMSANQLDAIRSRLGVALEEAERTVAVTSSPWGLFVQSLIIMLREGLEAILVLSALMTFLVKMGAGSRKRDLHIGVGIAAVMSLLTAVALETVFQITPAKQEAMEGVTLLVATVMLFWVSYWLLSKIEVAKWNSFVRGKIQDAVTDGSRFALGSVAFLAVYREGFETVLFYKALWVSAGHVGARMPIVGGILVGLAILLVVYFAINRFGVRLPLKPFFAVTSAFLYYMAFVFVGKGIAELQEGGLIGSTFISDGPRVPAMGIYPTIESLSGQALMVLLAVVALVWTFIVAPRRRLQVTSVMVPDSSSAGTQRVPATRDRDPVNQIELMRSLERIEADLAEIRAEVDRMKSRLKEGQRGPAGGGR